MVRVASRTRVTIGFARGLGTGLVRSGRAVARLSAVATCLLVPLMAVPSNSLAELANVSRQEASAVACAPFTGTSFDNRGHARAAFYPTVIVRGASCATARTLLAQIGRRKVSGTATITIGSFQCMLTVIASSGSGTCFNKGSHPGISPRQITWVAAFR
jgi:hypothetical protein